MKLAIYDFDGTYISIQVLSEIFKFWKKKGLDQSKLKEIYRLIRRRYILHKLRLFGWNKHTFRANAMALTADMFRTISRNDLNIFLQELYIYLQKFININMKNQLQSDKENGYYTVLLSGNFNVILEPFLKEGFDEVIGTNATKNNEIIESKDVKIIIHNIKQEVVKTKFVNANFKDSKAYADSYYDLPILELVGEPIVVNPDKKLAKIASKRGYRFFGRN